MNQHPEIKVFILGAGCSADYGYSFSAIDSRHMVNEILGKATQCRKIVIQNPDVETVRANLRSYSQLNGRLEFDASLFGENL